MVELKVDVIEQGSPRQVAAKMPEVVTAALGETVLHWHETFLPKHFTVAANTLYNLRARSERYMRMKTKKNGETRPLVFGGETERQALGGIWINKTGETAAGKILVPWYIRQF